MKKIAIIGGGISGLSTAYHLHRDYDITIFEKENYFGGHTDTHVFEIDSTEVRVDSGFIIFCPQHYPHFSAMLEDLGVASQPTNMSFSAYNQETGVVYNATSLNRLFCQRRNLISLRFWKMLLDIVRFYATSKEVLKHDNQMTVKQYLKSKRYGRGFIDDHLFPMISALWSAPPEQVEQFPIRHLVEFFNSHSLMKLIRRPQWRVIKNGSASYVEALRQKLACEWFSDSAVAAVSRGQNEVTISTENGSKQKFDAVVFAAHSNQVLSMLEDPSPDEQTILGAIPYERNHVVVHTDDSIMHPNKLAWASWNTEVPNRANQNSLRCCTANYWMNSLQGLDLTSNVFTTLNSTQRIDPSKILAERTYAHPVFNADSVAAQKHKHQLDGSNRSYYVGAYWGWGFHEDGARSASEVSRLIREQL